MSDHDITALLSRDAEAVPPPPATELATVLRAGDRRRHRRHGGYAMTAVVAVLMVAGLGWAVRPEAAPVISPGINEPFETVLAAVPVCGSTGDCQPVAPELIEQTVHVIDASGIAEVVEVRDAEEVASGSPTDDGSSPPAQFVQSLASQVIIRVSETSDPTPLFRDLVELPFVDSVHLGTAEVAPSMWVGGAQGEAPPPKVERVEYRTVEVPVAGSDQTVTYSTYRNDQGQLCIGNPRGYSCGWTQYGQGLLSGGVGPWTGADVERHCADGLTGYDVADVVIERSDGTTVPTVSAPARTDLPFPRVYAGCWHGPSEDITVVAYDADGHEVDRTSTTDADLPGTSRSERSSHHVGPPSS